MEKDLFVDPKLALFLSIRFDWKFIELRIPRQNFHFFSSSRIEADPLWKIRFETRPNLISSNLFSSRFQRPLSKIYSTAIPSASTLSFNRVYSLFEEDSGVGHDFSLSFPEIYTQARSNGGGMRLNLSRLSSRAQPSPREWFSKGKISGRQKRLEKRYSRTCCSFQPRGRLTLGTKVSRNGRWTINRRFSNIFSVTGHASAKAWGRDTGKRRTARWNQVGEIRQGTRDSEYRSIVYRIVWLAISGNRDRLGDPPSNPKCIFAA